MFLCFVFRSIYDLQCAVNCCLKSLVLLCVFACVCACVCVWFKSIKAFKMLTPALVEHLIICIDADDTHGLPCMGNYFSRTALTMIYSILEQVVSSVQVTYKRTRGRRKLLKGGERDGQKRRPALMRLSGTEKQFEMFALQTTISCHD